MVVWREGDRLVMEVHREELMCVLPCCSKGGGGDRESQRLQRAAMIVRSDERGQLTLLPIRAACHCISDGGDDRSDNSLL